MDDVTALRDALLADLDSDLGLLRFNQADYAGRLDALIAAVEARAVEGSGVVEALEGERDRWKAEAEHQYRLRTGLVERCMFEGCGAARDDWKHHDGPNHGHGSRINCGGDWWANCHPFAPEAALPRPEEPRVTVPCVCGGTLDEASILSADHYPAPRSRGWSPACSSDVATR